MAEITLNNLEYIIDGQTILKDINLSIIPGENFVVMGPSGCGKSTLLRLILGVISPTSGWVEIDGINTSSLNADEWQNIRKKMGMVFQSAALFDSMNVFDNVAFGLRRNKVKEKEAKERVIQSLAIVGLTEQDASKMPADLSGGMKKRVAIARAIATEPPILLYDEPTTGLDPIMADIINELIRSLQRQLGITSIIVTHDIMSVLTVADRVGLLDQGHLAEVCERSQLKNTNHPMLKDFLKSYQSNL